MSVLRALVVGVSNYTAMNQDNLNFCKNDISAICDALVCGLKVEESNISTYGNDGTVRGADLVGALKDLISITSVEDTLIFYFSGHGGTLATGHNLLLSDCCVSTTEIITLLENISAKNKIIILDCCKSGNFSVNHTATFNINDTIEEFVGKGYAVLASSSSTQVSYGHPNKPVSLFTSFLCEVLKDVHIIKKGKKSLYDINRLLSLYLDIWNKKNPTMQQNPVFRANMGGTIFFEIQEYQPFCSAKIYDETDDYIMYAVEPLHTVLAKRYAVKVILKSPFSFEDISQINHEIINKIKKADVYKNEITQRYWLGKDTNMVFCYYGRDESDIVNSNYLCNTTWVDGKQDKKWWYRLNENSAIINDIHFSFHSYYEHLKVFKEEHIEVKDVLIKKTKYIMSHLITLAEKAVGLYNEFLNGTKSEETLVNEMDLIIPSIEKYYFEETELAIPPIELKAWSQCCSNLAGTIYDFTLFYNKKNFACRTSQNRIDCMNMTINKYYEDLETLKETEVRI